MVTVPRVKVAALLATIMTLFQGAHHVLAHDCDPVSPDVIPPSRQPGTVMNRQHCQIIDNKKDPILSYHHCTFNGTMGSGSSDYYYNEDKGSGGGPRQLVVNFTPAKYAPSYIQIKQVNSQDSAIYEAYKMCTFTLADSDVFRLHVW